MLEGKKVLIVEDAPISRDFLKEILIQLNPAQIDEAENGAIALDFLKKRHAENQKIDLILCDINMPIMTGIEFLRAIKSDNRFDQIPVIMTTAEGETTLVLEVITLGVSNYIVKPVTQGVLVEKLNSLFN